MLSTVGKYITKFCSFSLSLSLSLSLSAHFFLPCLSLSLFHVTKHSHIYSLYILLKLLYSVFLFYFHKLSKIRVYGVSFPSPLPPSPSPPKGRCSDRRLQFRAQLHLGAYHRLPWRRSQQGGGPIFGQTSKTRVGSSTRGMVHNMHNNYAQHPEKNSHLSLSLSLSQAVSRIEVELATAQASIANLDLYVLHHDMFGKGVIKRMGISPDGFIQMALQLAYYKVCFFFASKENRCFFS